MPKSVLRSILYYVYSIYVHIYIPEKRSEVYIVLCIAYIFIFSIYVHIYIPEKRSEVYHVLCV